MAERYIRSDTVRAKGSTFEDPNDILIPKKGQDVKIPRDLILEEREDAAVRFETVKFNVESEIGEYKESPMFGDQKLYSLALKARLDRREANLFPVSYDVETTEAEHYDPIPFEIVHSEPTDASALINNIVRYPGIAYSNPVSYDKGSSIATPTEFGVERAMTNTSMIPRTTNVVNADPEEYVQLSGIVTVYANSNLTPSPDDEFVTVGINFTPPPNEVVFSGTVSGAPNYIGGFYGSSGLLELTSSVVDDPYERPFGVDVFQGEGSFTVLDIDYSGNYILDFDVTLYDDGGPPGSDPSFINVQTSDDVIFDGSYAGPIEISTNFGTRIFITIYSNTPTDVGIDGTWSLTFVDFPNPGIVDPEFESIVNIRMEVGEGEYLSPDALTDISNYEFNQIFPLTDSGRHTFPISCVFKAFTGRWDLDTSNPDYSTAGYVKFYVTCDSLSLAYVTIQFYLETLGREFSSQQD